MIYILIFLFGLIIGSFLNHIIYRISLEDPSYKKLFNFKNRSYCPHCKHALSWKDLFPVLSFLYLKGKCRYCQKNISWQYPIVEVLTGLSFLVIFYYKFSVNFSVVELLFLFYIVSSLIIIFVYDLKNYIIPDQILFPAIGVSLIYRLAFSYSDLIYYIAAAAGASLFFAAIYFISKGAWIGFGDVKLAILLGLVLGYPLIAVGLFLSFFVGAIIGIIIILLGKKGLKSEIPFAPFLISGTFMAMIFGQDIISWYISLFYF